MTNPRQLPRTWTTVRIVDVATFIRGVSYSKVDASSTPGEGLTPVLRANNISQGLNFDDLVYVPDRYIAPAQLVQDGDVVIAMSSGSKSVVGKAAQAKRPPRCGFGAFCGLVRPSAVVNPSLLGYYFQTKAYRNAVSEASKGVNINNLKAEHILSRPFPLAPESEQGRIASKIDELFSEIEEGERALDRVQKLVERYRQSVLKAAVTGELTAESRNRKRDRLESGDTLLKRILLARRQAWERKELDKFKAKGLKTVSDRWKTKYPEPCAPDDAMLPELPAGWIWASIDQVSLNHDGARIPVKASDRDKRSGPYPYYGAQGVIDNIDEFLFDGDFLLVAEDGENLRSRIKPLAFPASGRFWVNNHAHVLSSFPGVELSFLEIAINSLDISRSVTGTAQPKLTQAALSRLPIPVPPIDEQLEITSLVNAVLVHCRIALQSANQESRRANALRQSILKEAFSGGLVSKCNDDPVVRRPDEVAERHSVSARGAKKVRAT